jgi:signal transduction histidine kinase/HAMP domain-containing protein
MAPSFNPLRTIRGQIFLGFVAMSVLTGALGFYGIYAASRANRIVADIYDRPLMAINFARSAGATFVAMENDLLQTRLARQASPPAALDQLSEAFFDDLAIARQRSISPAAALTAVEIEGLAREWLAIVAGAANEAGQFPSGASAKAGVLSHEIVQRFDRLIELTAEDGFRERQRSLGEIGATMLASVGCTALALIVAAAITFLLARRILKPLCGAAAVADRIAQGELDAEIPSGRHDEIGRLLRSMYSMQTSIRTMMNEEAEQRRSAQRRLVDAIEGSQEGMMLVGADRRIVIANTQMQRFLPGAAGGLVAGADFAEVIARAVPPGTATTAEGVVNEPARVLASEGEVRLGGELWLKVSRGATQDGGFFLFWSDISAIKERELRLREAKAEAEAASQAKSSFLANMSHELRTPLNAIIGFSEIMVNRVFGELGNPRYHDYAKLITTSGRHLLDIISSILDFAKCEAGQTVLHREATDLREVAQACVGMVEPQCASSGLTLALRIPADPITVMGEPAKLRQMLLNLLSNAVKFTPAGGAVSVIVERDSGGLPLLSVRDSGIGMKPDDIPIALTPFGQIESGLNRSYEGTGLGLPLTKAFAELHGASFEITSAPGEGTTVALRFANDNAPTPAAAALAYAAG